MSDHQRDLVYNGRIIRKPVTNIWTEFKLFMTEVNDGVCGHGNRLSVSKKNRHFSIYWAEINRWNGSAVQHMTWIWSSDPLSCSFEHVITLKRNGKQCIMPIQDPTAKPHDPHLGRAQWLGTTDLNFITNVVMKWLREKFVTLIKEFWDTPYNPII
jgi:hypothetical protein